MEEKTEIQTFVRKGPGGPERAYHFAPWPAAPDGQPAVTVMIVEVTDGGGGELRHLSYDDPPGTGTTPDEYRRMLASAVDHCGSETEFVMMLVFFLARDLVMAHGADPHVAIRAVTEFARKVYAEFSA